MTTHKIFWIDAFATERFRGNQCAVIFDADGFSDELMQKIAIEMNLSETAFLVKSRVADFGSRYFTPAGEIPLAGHPTIALFHALVEAKKIQLTENKKKFSLELKAGIVSVEVINDGLLKFIMTQRKPEFFSTHDKSEIAKIFSLHVTDLMDHVPVQTVSTGTPQLMVPLKNLDAVKRARINPELYLRYKAQADFFSPHLFCLESPEAGGTTFARHLGVSPEPVEDPFTGSATGAMAAYLWRYHLIHHPKFIAHQGHFLSRPGVAEVEIMGSREDIVAIKVGGSAVTVFTAELTTSNF